MRTFARVCIGLVGGFVLGAALGMIAVQVLSPNTHDKALEATMTAAFVAGPLGAIIGTIVAIFWRRR